jgi:hypothetical protein
MSEWQMPVTRHTSTRKRRFKISKFVRRISALFSGSKRRDENPSSDQHASRRRLDGAFEAQEAVFMQNQGEILPLADAVGIQVEDTSTPTAAVASPVLAPDDAAIASPMVSPGSRWNVFARRAAESPSLLHDTWVEVRGREIWFWDSWRDYNIQQPPTLVIPAAQLSGLNPTDDHSFSLAFVDGTTIHCGFDDSGEKERMCRQLRGLIEANKIDKVLKSAGVSSSSPAPGEENNSPTAKRNKMMKSYFKYNAPPSQQAQQNGRGNPLGVRPAAAASSSSYAFNDDNSELLKPPAEKKDLLKRFVVSSIARQDPRRKWIMNRPIKKKKVKRVFTGERIKVVDDTEYFAAKEIEKQLCLSAYSVSFDEEELLNDGGDMSPTAKLVKYQKLVKSLKTEVNRLNTILAYKDQIVVSPVSRGSEKNTLWASISAESGIGAEGCVCVENGSSSPEAKLDATSAAIPDTETAETTDVESADESGVIFSSDCVDNEPKEAANVDDDMGFVYPYEDSQEENYNPNL